MISMVRVKYNLILHLIYYISVNVLIFFYFIMVFIPGDGMIQEEELEAVVRASLQVHTAFEMTFNYPLKF